MSFLIVWILLSIPISIIVGNIISFYNNDDET